MLNALSPSALPPCTTACNADIADVVETRLWLEEHEWLYALLHRSDNSAPTFRIPDLLSACVALVFSRADAAAQIFGFMGTELVLRSPTTVRRRESLWRGQFDLLHDLQCSPLNRHPYPNFQLDQLTTACVALCRLEDPSGSGLLQQARLNMVERLRAKRPGSAASCIPN